MAMLITNFNKLIQSKIVWGLFILLVAFAFVAMDMATTDGAPQETISDVLGTIFEEDITRGEFLSSYRNVYLIYSIMTGEALQIDEETDLALTEAAWNRLAVLKKAKEIGYTATPDQIVDAIKSLPIFQNQQTGGYDANIYNSFVDNFLTSMGMTAKDFERAYAENIILEQASFAAGQNAIVTEEETIETYHLLNDLITLDTALIPKKKKLAKRVDKNEVEEFYNNNKSLFEISERVSIDYVKFDISEYIDSAEISEEMITQSYSNNIENYRLYDESDSENTLKYQELAEVRSDIESTLRVNVASQTAFIKADTLVAALSNEGADFYEEAEALGKEVLKDMKPFSLNAILENIDNTAPFTTAAFNLDLTPNQYYSDPVVGSDHIYVIALKERLPAYIPNFEEVADTALKLAQDQAEENAYDTFVNDKIEEIESLISEGKSFKEAIKSARLSSETLKPYNSQIPLEHPKAAILMEQTYLLDSGQLAPPIQTEEGVLIACVSLRDIANTNELSNQKDRIQASLIQQKRANLISSWQADIIAEANIQIFEDKPNS